MKDKMIERTRKMTIAVIVILTVLLGFAIGYAIATNPGEEGVEKLQYQAFAIDKKTGKIYDLKGKGFPLFMEKLNREGGEYRLLIENDEGLNDLKRQFENLKDDSKKWENLVSFIGPEPKEGSNEYESELVLLEQYFLNKGAFILDVKHEKQEILKMKSKEEDKPGEEVYLDIDIRFDK